MTAARPSATQRGFTLIELLVALAVMALMATMGWRALAGMQQAQEVNQSVSDAVLTTEAGLNQWTTDLDAVQELPATRAMEWDGRSLRITRRAAPPTEGVTVVAWTRATRQGTPQWLRWQSAPVQSIEAWQAAWAAASAWAQGTESPELRAREVAITGLEQWQLFFYRGGAWSNPLSSTGTPDMATAPDGVRLVLTLPASHPLAGSLVRDWASGALTGAGQ
ncbi:PulJ/GspJ family protein [Rhodoferax bucti]|uniref:PulJ/GspJ family protein n=1 Tax=Rhodoferax bucti TaxID=2576305 RepID=UPI001107EAB3|nr:prepilin-type N-terminal cleavage/methylation domain-containing protein [Rhodoferax bucti]